MEVHVWNNKDALVLRICMQVNKLVNMRGRYVDGVSNKVNNVNILNVYARSNMLPLNMLNVFILYVLILF